MAPIKVAMILTDSERLELQQQSVWAYAVQHTRLIVLLADAHAWVEIRTN